jgi:hypothetical protein
MDVKSAVLKPGYVDPKEALRRALKFMLKHKCDVTFEHRNTLYELNMEGILEALPSTRMSDKV